MINKDYDDKSRTTAVLTMEEMVASALAHPEMWARETARRAKNIEYAKSQQGFDPVKLREMVEHQEWCEAAIATADKQRRLS